MNIACNCSLKEVKVRVLMFSIVDSIIIPLWNCSGQKRISVVS